MVKYAVSQLISDQNQCDVPDNHTNYLVSNYGVPRTMGTRAIKLILPRTPTSE